MKSMLSHAIFTTVCIILGNYSFAQLGTVSVTFSCSKNLPDSIFLSIIELDKNALIDSNGFVSIDSIPKSHYTLEVFAYRYGSSSIGQISFEDTNYIAFEIENPFCCQYSFNPKKCPVCKLSDKAIPIRYNGYSGINKNKKEEYLEGGCTIIALGCNPKKYCKRDKLEY